MTDTTGNSIIYNKIYPYFLDSEDILLFLEYLILMIHIKLIKRMIINDKNTLTTIIGV
jgi:hypothetical protein